MILIVAEHRSGKLNPASWEAVAAGPQMAGAAGARSLLADGIAVRRSGEGLSLVRPMFQGKLVAEVVPAGDPPYFVTLQVGAFRADAAARGGGPGPVSAVSGWLGAPA